MKKALLLDYFGVLVSNDQLNTELLAVIQKVREQGSKVFVLSNADTSLGEQELSRHPVLWEMCDKFYYSGATGFIKPDPRAFTFILEEQALPAAECIYFDDSEKNVQVAAALGIESYLYRSPAQAALDLGL